MGILIGQGALFTTEGELGATGANRLVSWEIGAIGDASLFLRALNHTTLVPIRVNIALVYFCYAGMMAESIRRVREFHNAAWQRNLRWNTQSEQETEK